MSQTAFLSRWQAVRAAVDQACIDYGRSPGSVQVLPVSKTFEAPVVQQAIDAGVLRFGENRAQELQQKAQALSPNVRWALIGHLQTNKAKVVARYAHEIHSLDSWELAVALDRRLQIEGRQLEALIQVKTSSEASKTGVLPADVAPLLQRLRSLDTLVLKGLMTVAVNSPEEMAVRTCFRQLRQLAEQLRQQSGLALPVLSMGMSGDFRWAIAEGATEVRMGSALFGARDYGSA